MYISTVYTVFMAKARVFKSGNSQAVRLPKRFRVSVKELEISRNGDEIVLRTPKRNLLGAVNALYGMPKDFMKGGRRDSRPQKRRGL